MIQTIRQWLLPATTISPSGHAPFPSPASHQAASRRLGALHPFAKPGLQDIATQPLLIVDVETSGLDLNRDDVLSIGAVRIEGMGIMLGHTFQRVLNVPTRLSPDSQLFHGLTQADLQRGDDPDRALLDLLEFGQDAIWLAWHAWFDQKMLHRSAKRWLRLPRALRPDIQDLADIAPAVFPEHAEPRNDLDRWLECMGLQNSMRHDAAADAMATAELTLMCLHRARARGLNTWGELAKAAQRQARASKRQSQALLAGA